MRARVHETSVSGHGGEVYIGTAVALRFPFHVRAVCYGVFFIVAYPLEQLTLFHGKGS